MTEWLQSFAQSQEFPWIAAFALGLLTAISPCPLATNITATAYIAKGFQHKRMVVWSGILYTLGRSVSYIAIALILYLGASKFQIARFLQANGEKWLGPLLIIIGLVMLNVIPLNFKGGKLLEKFTDKVGSHGLVSAFILGIVFALAFCPYSGALYFGMLIPMTLQSTDALTLPLLFAIGTGLPVLLFTILIAYSIDKLGRWFNVLKRIEIIVRTIVGFVFLTVGLYYVAIFSGILS
jgi:cytochrome c biogenesis protein CcdA